MSRFKDQVAADIKQVFINPLEFAEPHNINGIDMMVVIDKDVLNERLSVTNTQYVEGVFKDEMLLYIDAKDMPRKPVIGEILRLDGEIYLVSDVAANMGVYEVTIEANEA